MSIAWLLYVLGVGALLAAAALALGAALRAVRAPQRWAYAIALAAMVMLAAVAPMRVRSPTTVDLPVSVTVAGAVARPAASGVVAWIRASRTRAEQAADLLAARAESAIRPSVRRAALAAWAAASVGLLALFVIVHVRLLIARRRWPVAHVDRQPVRVAPRTGPAVVGFSRAEIVVPRALLERSADEQRLILAHEREHLRARDHLLLAGGWAIAIAFPWHPAAWLLLDRLRLAIELDCDARVLRAGAGARSYGALLIDMAAQASGIRMGALALADGPSHLERRILAMNTMRLRHATAYGALAGTIGLALVLVACEARVPTAAEVDAMDVGAAEKQAMALKITDARAAKADYFLDGVKVTSAQAHGIDGKDIGSIEIVKSENPVGRDTIFLTSRARMPKDSLLDKIADPFRASENGALTRVRSGSQPDAEPPVTSVQKLRLPGDPSVVVMIDGKESSRAALERLDPKTISSVSVYKGDGVLGGDPRTAKGVIFVETKAKRP